MRWCSNSTPPAKEFLIDKGYNPDFGARPLRRAISKYVEDPLSEGILRDEFSHGHLIKVTREDEKDHLTFKAEDKSPSADKDDADDKVGDGQNSEATAEAGAGTEPG